jgi:hypothetical protein
MKKQMYVVFITVICLFVIIPSPLALNIKNTNIEKSQFLEKSFLDVESGNRTTIYFASAEVEYYKGESGPFSYYGRGFHVSVRGTFYSVDADLENLVVALVMNYSVEMDFDSPVILAPIVAFGLKIENYTDGYVWESYKLKHNGYVKYQGNISIEIPFDMDNITSGDKFLLDPTIAIVGDPFVYNSKDDQISKFTSFLLRFIYLTSEDKYLLYKFIFPFIAEHNWVGSYGERIKIGIVFE